ncbi:ABC transporter permease [Aliidiomarina celeris]|uniref:ABC transporter permease n=1 Tax=Aliidiomarina celeris TaxID=2249428 RepID=UPI000DE9ACF3|nr:ABC transporter permease [Aliidiomarina celeris]
MLISIARKSLMNRRSTVVMTLASLVISLTLLFAIEHLREQARGSFYQAVSGTDLIVGARSGQLNLLLYSVFRIGNPTANVSWDSFQTIQNMPRIRWTIPISLGDSHRGYAVIGTNSNYFEHFRYARDRGLNFQAGEPFNDLYDAVIGADVARALGYSLGDSITLAHGTGSVSFVQHDDKPFRIVGILEPTGTPVDQSVHITLEGLQALHVAGPTNLQGPGVKASNTATNSAEHARTLDLTPASVSAILVGVDNRAASLMIQRQINTYRGEALSAIIPGVAMAELWRMLASFENMLRLISFMVLIACLVGLTTTLLAAMKEREREIAILRATGARPWHIFMLIQAEVVLIMVSAIVLSIGLLWSILASAQQTIVERFGVLIESNPLSMELLVYSGIALGLAVLLAFIPATLAFRAALTKGLTPRV